MSFTYYVVLFLCQIDIFFDHDTYIDGNLFIGSTIVRNSGVVKEVEAMFYGYFL